MIMEEMNSMDKIAVSGTNGNDDDDARCFCFLFLCDIILSVPIFFKFNTHALMLFLEDM